MVLEFSYMYHLDQDWHILSVYKGNKNKDVFGKSTVDLPASMCPSLNKSLIITSVLSLIKESNGKSLFWLSVPSICWYFFYSKGRMTVPLPESCCCFPLLWKLRVWCGAELVSCNIWDAQCFTPLYVWKTRSEMTGLRIQCLHLLIDWGEHIR